VLGSAHGNGSSIVHGNMNINSVTYSGAGNEENVPPSDQNARTRKRPRTEDSYDTINSYHDDDAGPTGPTTPPAGINEVSPDLAMVLSRQHSLNDNNKTMLFSFHRVSVYFYLSNLLICYILYRLPPR
jgi:hypothetical protein